MATSTTRLQPPPAVFPTIYGMRETKLTRLRRKRCTIQRAVMPVERALALHHARLAEVEAAILVPDLVLDIPLLRPKRAPIFARGELTALTLDMLRKAGRPLAMRKMARPALPMKGYGSRTGRRRHSRSDG